MMQFQLVNMQVLGWIYDLSKGKDKGPISIRETKKGQRPDLFLRMINNTHIEAPIVTYICIAIFLGVYMYCKLME